MNAKIILSALLCAAGLNAAESRSNSPDSIYERNNENRGSVGRIGNTGDTDESDSSYDSTDDKAVADAIRVVEMRFSNRGVFGLATVIASEQALDAYSEARKRKILRAYPEFRTFLQLNDTIGAQLRVERETYETHKRRIIVSLARPIAMTSVPQELRDNTIPYVTCRLHTKKELSHRNEINCILAQQEKRATRRAVQQEVPSVADRLVSWVRDRLHQE